MVEDLGFLRLAGLDGLEPPALGFVGAQEVPSRFALEGWVILPCLARGQKGVLGNVCSDPGGEPGNFLLQGSSFLASHAMEGLVHSTGQLLAEEGLDLLTPQAKQPVQAEVQVGQIELEKVAQQVLKLAHGVQCSLAISPTPPA